MKIPFVNLKAQYHTIKPQIDLVIQNVIEETSFIGGHRVKEFEDSFAKAYGVKHCISTANGTDSLYIVLKMLGIGIGDEVITVANSWISSSEVISQTGARPVFVDIDPQYYTIDENLLESKITVNTKCIIPVHLYGQMCDMDKISEIANKYNIPILEDCAQSHFSEFKGIRAGLIGLAGSFSFYPGKNLGAYGDAGCLITNDDDLALKCRMFARHGALKKHEHEMEGINSRLDGIQAAILSVKLPYILEWTNQRNRVADLYTKLLSEVNSIVTPIKRPDTLHSYHLYVIRCDNRDALQEFLLKNGVETSVHYPIALPNMNAYKYLGYSKNDFPVASDYQNKILSLPIYPELSDNQVGQIVVLIKQYYKN